MTDLLRIIFKGLTEYFKMLIETEPKRKGFVIDLKYKSPKTKIRVK